MCKYYGRQRILVIKRREERKGGDRRKERGKEE
jgi:hypothetical protein